MSALWGAWSPDWSLYDKVDFDGINKIVYVHPDVTSLDIRQDVYTSWVDWVVLRDNLKFAPAIRTTGLDPIGVGAFTGDVYFMINGWKLAVNLQRVRVTGVLYSDDYETAYFTESLTPQYPATVSALVNTVAPVVTIDNISVPTAQEIRQEIDLNSTKLSTIQSNVAAIPAAVRSQLSPELAHVLTLQNNPGLTSSQATMLIELYVIMGLDPSKPLYVDMTSRTAGTIVQTIQADDTETTMTRIS